MELVSRERTTGKPLCDISLCFWFAYSLLELADSRKRCREYATLMASGCTSSVTLLSVILHFAAQWQWHDFSGGNYDFVLEKIAHKHTWKELPIACKFATPLVTFDNFKSLNFSNSRDTGLIIKVCKCMWWGITSFHAFTRKRYNLLPLQFYNFSDCFLLCKLV